MKEVLSKELNLSLKYDNSWQRWLLVVNLNIFSKLKIFCNLAPLSYVETSRIEPVEYLFWQKAKKHADNIAII